MEHFSKRTFAYFEAAAKAKDESWFESHADDYDEHVRQPMAALVAGLEGACGKKLPRIAFDVKKLSRPVRRDGAVRANAMAHFSEKQTSRFEWNPGVYISLGAEPEDNVLGIGLYMPSSRQQGLLRGALVRDFKTIDGILRRKALVERWGGLQGETFKRFPRGFDPESAAAKYLVHKQFYLGKHPTRAAITRKTFAAEVAEDVRSALDFLVWVRKTVGTFGKV